MSFELTQRQLEALRSYSEGKISAIDLCRRLGDATYGEVLCLLGARLAAWARAAIGTRASLVVPDA